MQVLMLGFATYSLLGFLLGVYNSKVRKNSAEPAPFFLPTGAFVWADAVTFGLFWATVSIVIYFLKDWILFLLIYSLFWTVRSWGEVTYWINQQFSRINRNPPETYFFHSIFESNNVRYPKEYVVWFVWQTFWQVVTVISLVLTIYFASLWL